MAEPRDVIVATHSEFQINDAPGGGIELVQFSANRLAWRHVISPGIFREALQKYLDRTKPAGD